MPTGYMSECSWAIHHQGDTSAVLSRLHCLVRARQHPAPATLSLALYSGPQLYLSVNTNLTSFLPLKFETAEGQWQGGIFGGFQLSNRILHSLLGTEYVPPPGIRVLKT